MATKGGVSSKISPTGKVGGELLNRREAGESDISVRVGAIEIGSRATRLLVADVSDKGGIETLATRAENTRLMECVEQGDAAIRQELSNIYEIATGFREQAVRLGADRVAVFGTESIRQVASLDIFRASTLAGKIDEILDERTEAMCSLLAGILGLSKTGRKCDRVLVIDQGAGSMELAAGKCGPPIELLDFSSLKLGGNALLNLLRSHHLDVKKFRSDVDSALETCKIPVGDFDQVIMQGTVATKCAWLMERNDKREKYDPRRVHGRKLSTKQLEYLISFVEKISGAKWATFQDFVNPGEPNGDAAERVASGIIPLVHLLKHFDKSAFVVSAYGTRHGMAWLLAHRPAGSTKGNPSKGQATETAATILLHKA